MDDKNMSMKPEHPMGCQCPMCAGRQMGMMHGCGCGGRSVVRCIVAIVVLVIACSAAFQLGQLKGLMMYGRYDRSYDMMMPGRGMMMNTNRMPGNTMMMESGSRAIQTNPSSTSTMMMPQ